MRHNKLILILLFILAGTTFSQSIMEIVFGSTSESIAVNSISKITFTSSDMVVHGSGNTYAINSIRKIFFKEGTLNLEKASPAKLSCSVNPNPCNPSTTLSLTLPADARTDISVYNQAGARIKELVSGHLQAGPHRVAWDGTDHKHWPVASGIYIMTVQYGSRTMNRKIVLLK
jgi:flagellar hook assembly protein FlgD